MRPIYLCALLILPSCIGGTLGNHNDIEEYPLREARKSEAQRLKRCLKAADHFQKKRIKETGAPYKSAAEMPVDPYCNGILVSQQATKEGYEIVGQFHEEESTVRWSVNQAGIIEEHLGGEGEGEIDSFM